MCSYQTRCDRPCCTWVHKSFSDNYRRHGVLFSLLNTSPSLSQDASAPLAGMNHFPPQTKGLIGIKTRRDQNSNPARPLASSVVRSFSDLLDHLLWFGFFLTISWSYFLNYYFQELLAETAFKEMDANSDGKVTIDEFVGACMKQVSHQ
jgi:hypothetical protein